MRLLDRGRRRDAHASNGGWPVGLYLAALALEEGSSLDARVDAFAGDDRIVADYLWLEFLSRLSEEELDFPTGPRSSSG